MDIRRCNKCKGRGVIFRIVHLPNEQWPSSHGGGIVDVPCPECGGSGLQAKFCPNCGIEFRLCDDETKEEAFGVF